MSRVTTCIVRLARPGLCAALLVAAPPAIAEPVTDRILSDVSVIEEPGCARVKITFNLPVRYLSHFPYERGRDLCIRIRPIAIAANDKLFRFGREALRAPASDLAAISSIEYLGDAVGGPCLNVFFRYPVNYRVVQGPDYRSIDVAISGPQPSASCRPGQSDNRGTGATPPGDPASPSPPAVRPQAPNEAR
jgi:hypothetical protein